MESNQQNVESGGYQESQGKKRRDMTTGERVSLLQESLYQKAKQDRTFKFYVLYDKMFIPYMLLEAWKSVKSNGGSPGIDGYTIKDVENYGVERYLNELGEELRKQSYRPQAVKRVMIPKANGGERPLGIPTIKDRLAQTVCKMILEPIFEADFKESSYGFRPDRSAKDAITAIKSLLQQGKTDVLDADLSKYFDTIPHDKLMVALKERISDPRILKLIMSWLKAPVYEDGQMKGGKKNHQGTPQGGVISPLLANLYLHLLDRIVSNPHSIFHKFGIEIVRYADDFVLMGNKIPEAVTEKLKDLLNRMGLALNEAKTKHRQAKEESFNFLGFTIRYNRDLKGRNSHYWNIEASDKSEKKIRERIKEYLDTHGHFRPEAIVKELNSRIRGWLNYFEIKGVSYPAMNKRGLRHYLSAELHRYFHRKSQRKSRLYRQNAFEILVQKYGLIDPTKYTLSTTRL